MWPWLPERVRSGSSLYIYRVYICRSYVFFILRFFFILLNDHTIFRLTTVRKWITDGRVVREEQREMPAAA